MPVIRIAKTSNYVVMSNEFLRNKEMSLKSKGLLALMLSLPDNWDYSVDGLCSICKENVTAITAALKELEEFRYLIREKVHRNGKFEWDYIVFETSQIQDPGFLPIENLSIENQPQLNTNKQSTKIQKDAKCPSQNSSKLFSIPHDKSQKVQQWYEEKAKLIIDYKFSQPVEKLLSDFLSNLMEMNVLLPYLSIASQLSKLIKLPEDKQIEAVSKTVTCGWRSLEYAIKDIQDTEKGRFDTAVNSDNQLKSAGASTRRSLLQTQEIY